jgi:hypothetical protein
MLIEIEIPDTLPEGRRSSFKKGIADILIELAAARTVMDHTPVGHDTYREQGKQTGRELDAKIQEAYSK